jgi:hypothetical protein
MCSHIMRSNTSPAPSATAAFQQRVLQRPSVDESGWWDTHHFGVNEHGQFTNVPDSERVENEAMFLPAFDGGAFVWDCRVAYARMPCTYLLAQPQDVVHTVLVQPEDVVHAVLPLHL